VPLTTLLTIAQDPETASYDGMPRSAIATGGVDHVLAVERMPEAILKYVRHDYVEVPAKPVPRAQPVAEELTAILPLLKARTHFDFGCYRKPTLRRRIPTDELAAHRQRGRVPAPPARR
jgi:two-component system CheB/CheR fusion protein